MNKQQNIEQFLYAMYYYKQISPNIELDKDRVYSSLIRNGVSASDVHVDSSANGNFDKWIEDFQVEDGIDVFVSPSWKYFCQFVHNKDRVLSKDEQIKMYIPLDGAHLTYGVERIFSFLEKAGIDHLSKVGKHVRFDDVVVRLGNEEDAKKLADYIRGDSYIQQGLIQANPFACSKEGIAYASDGALSFNSTVAAFVSLYVNDKYKNSNNGMHNGISLDDFRGFILNYYNDVILNPENFDKFCKDMNNGKYLSQSSITNYMRVTELIYYSTDPNFTYDDYIDYYRRNVNDYNRGPELDVKKNNYVEDTSTNYHGVDLEATLDLEEVRVHELLSKCLIEFGKRKNPDGSRKYSYDDVVSQIAAYLNTGDAKYITNSGGVRNDFVEANFASLLSSYAIRKNLSFNDILLDTKKEILDDSLGALLDKYGQGVDASFPIRNLFDTGKYSGFTSEKNSRSNMIAAVSVNDIDKIIVRDMGYSSDVSLMNMPMDQRDEIISSYAKNYRSMHYEGGKKI